MSNYFHIDDIEFMIFLYIADIIDDLIVAIMDDNDDFDLDQFDTEFWYSD